MTTQVIQAGANVRVIINPRVIASTQIVDGYLIVTYSDGTTENAGFIGGGSAPATIYNTLGTSTLSGNEVEDFTDLADIIDARLTALGH